MHVTNHLLHSQQLGLAPHVPSQSVRPTFCHSTIYQLYGWICQALRSSISGPHTHTELPACCMCPDGTGVLLAELHLRTKKANEYIRL
jgi:hypothetical protein